MILTTTALTLLCGLTPHQEKPAVSARKAGTVIMSQDEPSLKFQSEWGYADAVIADDGTIYLSGVVTYVLPSEKNYETSYTRTFEQIAKILNRAGASWDDVIEITSFHTDLTTQMPAMVAVKNRYVHAPFPAWTAIGVTRLIPDSGITEIRVIARKPKLAEHQKP